MLAILLTDYGNSFNYQLLPSAEILDFMTKGRRPSDGDRQSTVLKITPLNVLMRDQIGKMKGSGGKMCILKGDEVAAADGDEGLSLDAVYQRTSKQQPMILFSLIQRSRWKAVKPRN